MCSTWTPPPPPSSSCHVPQQQHVPQQHHTPQQTTSSAGPQIIEGPPGQMGMMGPMGPRGYSVKGDTGDKGEQGPKGCTGEIGPRGHNITKARIDPITNIMYLHSSDGRWMEVEGNVTTFAQTYSQRIENSDYIQQDTNSDTNDPEHITGLQQIYDAGFSAAFWQVIQLKYSNVDAFRFNIPIMQGRKGDQGIVGYYFNNIQFANYDETTATATMRFHYDNRKATDPTDSNLVQEVPLTLPRGPRGSSDFIKHFRTKKVTNHFHACVTYPFDIHIKDFFNYFHKNVDSVPIHRKGLEVDKTNPNYQMAQYEQFKILYFIENTDTGTLTISPNITTDMCDGYVMEMTQDKMFLTITSGLSPNNSTLPFNRYVIFFQNRKIECTDFESDDSNYAFENPQINDIDNNMFVYKVVDTYPYIIFGQIYDKKPMSNNVLKFKINTLTDNAYTFGDGDIIYISYTYPDPLTHFTPTKKMQGENNVFVVQNKYKERFKCDISTDDTNHYYWIPTNRLNELTGTYALCHNMTAELFPENIMITTTDTNDDWVSSYQISAQVATNYVWITMPSHNMDPNATKLQVSNNVYGHILERYDSNTRFKVLVLKGMFEKQYVNNYGGHITHIDYYHSIHQVESHNTLTSLSLTNYTEFKTNGKWFLQSTDSNYLGYITSRTNMVQITITDNIPELYLTIQNINSLNAFMTGFIVTDANLEIDGGIGIDDCTFYGKIITAVARTETLLVLDIELIPDENGHYKDNIANLNTPLYVFQEDLSPLWKVVESEWMKYSLSMNSNTFTIDHNTLRTNIIVRTDSSSSIPIMLETSDYILFKKDDNGNVTSIQHPHLSNIYTNKTGLGIVNSIEDQLGHVGHPNLVTCTTILGNMHPSGITICKTMGYELNSETLHDANISIIEDNEVTEDANIQIGNTFTQHIHNSKAGLVSSHTIHGTVEKVVKYKDVEKISIQYTESSRLFRALNNINSVEIINNVGEYTIQGSLFPNEQIMFTDTYYNIQQNMTLERVNLNFLNIDADDVENIRIHLYKFRHNTELQESVLRAEEPFLSLSCKDVMPQGTYKLYDEHINTVQFRSYKQTHVNDTDNSNWLSATDTTLQNTTWNNADYRDRIVTKGDYITVEIESLTNVVPQKEIIELYLAVDPDAQERGGNINWEPYAEHTLKNIHGEDQEMILDLNKDLTASTKYVLKLPHIEGPHGVKGETLLFFEKPHILFINGKKRISFSCNFNSVSYTHLTLPTILLV